VLWICHRSNDKAFFRHAHPLIVPPRTESAAPQWHAALVLGSGVPARVDVGM
jgi:hypothetical protein